MESLGWELIGLRCVGCPGDWGKPFVRRHHVEPDPDNQVIGRHTGKVDAGEMPCFAMTTVGADKVLGRQIVGTIRAGDMQRDAVVVLVEASQGMTPTYVHLVFAGSVDKHLNEPPLLNRD